MFQLDALYDDAYVCVMRRKHPLAQKPSISLDDYCAAEHLRVSFAGRPRGFVDEALARLGRERRVRITVHQFFTAGTVVHQSDLLTVLPRNFVAATGHAAGLVVRALPFALPRIDVGLLWHRRHEHDAGQTWLRAAVAVACAAVARESGHDPLDEAGHHPSLSGMAEPS